MRNYANLVNAYSAHQTAYPLPPDPKKKKGRRRQGKKNSLLSDGDGDGGGDGEVKAGTLSHIYTSSPSKFVSTANKPNTHPSLLALLPGAGESAFLICNGVDCPDCAGLGKVGRPLSKPFFCIGIDKT